MYIYVFVYIYLFICIYIDERGRGGHSELDRRDSRDYPRRR